MPGSAGVSIDGGSVVLSGTIEQRRNVEGVVAAAAAVPGVLELTSELTWSEDDSKPARVSGGYW